MYDPPLLQEGAHLSRCRFQRMNTCRFGNVPEIRGVDP
ncbi:hypothetical protein ASZ90_014950 [hydrocarbon metagenome]|uniref:Uncharacterized protein n=1 Tax=hydrocarbon metagenome TaxID=938273 RepID=A0A0W8F3D2_9ZZZZ